MQVTELQRQRNELQQCVDDVTEEHRQALLPKIDELRREALEIEEELVADRERRSEADKEVNDLKKQIEDLEGQVRGVDGRKISQHTSIVYIN